MTQQHITPQPAPSSAVMLRGTKTRKPRARHTRFSPKNLSFALASAFSAASASISQAITGLSITLAGLGAAQAQSQANNLPQGGVAVHGSASMQQSGNTLNVNTTNGAGNRSAINWQSFNIGAGHTTQINQPNAQSSSLNRVVTNAPSQIYGTLRSNGQVILVNQNGIAVGSGGVVDTAGFTASTLNISDADYKANRLRFEGNALSGGVQVDGVIRSSNGDVVLFAPQVGVGKAGVARADNGNVIIGAGQSVEVTGRGLEGVKFLIQGADNKAINLGTLQGNAVGVFAGTLRHSGVIQAQTATMEGGRVVLRAVRDVDIVKDASLANAPVINANGGVNAQGLAQKGGSVQIESAQGNVLLGAGSAISANAGQNLSSNQPLPGINSAGVAIEIVATQGRVMAQAGSAISATGQPGGTIRIYGGQEARIASVINASSPGLGDASAAGTLVLIGPANTGGTVHILSPQTVSLDAGAQLLASGDAGGGTILVGGDYQGATAAITNAQNTNISSGVLLEANARIKGNGGKVIVWADNDTHFSGTLNAKGGEQGGDGGFGETSGKKHLYFRGRADLSARRGRSGTLLLDPESISIQGGAGGAEDGQVSDNIVNAGDGSGSFTISEAALEALTGNVVLEASRYIQFQGTFGTNGSLAAGLHMAGDFTLRTRNQVGDPNSGPVGIYLGGWGNSTFNLSAAGNMSVLAGTGFTTGTLTPGIGSAAASLFTMKSGTGNILMESAGHISLGSGTSLQANSGSVTLRSKLGNISLGEPASSGAHISGQSMLLESQAADGLINLQGFSSLNASGTGTAITLRGDRLAMEASSTVVASAGAIEVRPWTGSRTIKLGGTLDTTGTGALQISPTEFNQFNANKALRFGDTNVLSAAFTGDIEIGGTVSLNVGSGALALLTTGGNVYQTQALISNELRIDAGQINLNNSLNIFALLAARSSTGAMNISTGSLSTILTTVDGLSGLQSAGTLSFSNTNLSPSQLNLFNGGNISAEGNISIAAFETITVNGGGIVIDSNTNNLGASGNISLGTAVVSTNQLGRNLTLDASSSNAVGGSISFGNVTPISIGDELNSLTVNSSGTSAGQINLPASITVGNGGASITGRVLLSNAASVNATGAGAITFNGEIQGNNNLNLNSDSGAITLNAIAGNGTNVGTIDIFSSNGTVNLNNNITTSAGTNVNVVAANINVGNNAQIYAGGLVYLEATGTAALNTLTTGAGSVLHASTGMLSILAEDNITLGGQVSGYSDIHINSSAGAVSMSSAVNVNGYQTTLSPGSLSISVHGQTGVTLAQLAASNNYNATVTTGAGQTIASAGTTNLAGFNSATLGSAAARSNIGSSGSRIALGDAGEITAYAANRLYLNSSSIAQDVTVAYASMDATSAAAVMEITSERNLQIFGGSGISVLGANNAEIKLGAAGSAQVLTGISGNGAMSSVFINANDKLVIGGGAQISNLGSLQLAGKANNQAIRIVDSDTVATNGGSLNIAYGSLNQIQNTVGHVLIGNTALSSGNITFEGSSAFNFSPTGSKNYSFFSGGNISSTNVRNMDLAQAGFSANGNIALNNVSIANSVAPMGVILAASAGGTMDLKVADADGVTLTTVGSSLPMAAQLTGLNSSGAGDIALTNLNGNVTSGTANFDIYAGLGKVTVKAYQDIGTVANPLAIHASGFTLGNEGGGVFQNLIAVALTRNSSTTVQTSDTSFDTGNHLGDSIYLKAGVGTNTLEINDGFGTGNVINRTLANAAGDIRVTQANAVFSGTGGTMTLSANSTTFEKLTTIAAGHTITATGGNSTITSGLGGLGGSGTFNNTGKILTVDGTIAPGTGGIGTLTVNGGVTMGSSGIFDAEIGTTATNGDRLIVGQNFVAGGTLRVAETNLLTTLTGTNYTLATANNASGSFASTTATNNSANFSAVSAAGVVTVNASSLTNKWNTTLSGAWGTAGANGNWSRGVTPTAVHDAWIDVAGFNPVVTVASAAVANSLKVGDTLTLNAGLSITGGMSVLNGGIFNHTNGSSGTITAGGNITVDAGGVMNWAGGTVGSAVDTSQLFTNNGTVNISGPGSSYQDIYRNWNNTGIINWSGGRFTELVNNNSGPITFTNAVAGQINLNTSQTGTDDFINGGLGKIINQGTITSASSNAATTTRLNVTQNALQNTGQIISNVGTLSIGSAGTLANDTGGYTVASGAALSFDNSRTLSTGATVAGTGNLRIGSGATLLASTGVSINPLANGRVDIAGNLNLATGQSETIASLTLAGGRVTSNNAVNISTLASSGLSRLVGSGLFTTTGNSSITNELTRELGDWSNTGALTVSGAGYIYLNQTATLSNNAAGSITFTSSGTTAITAGSGSNRFVNQGTLTNAAGATSRGISVNFDNSGSVRVTDNRLEINNSGADTGTYTVSSGAGLNIKSGAIRNFTSGGLLGTGLLDVTGGAITMGAGTNTSLLQNGTVSLNGGNLTLNTGAGFTLLNPLTITGGSTLNFSSAMAGALNLGNGLLTSAGFGWTLPAASNSFVTTGSGQTFSTGSNTTLTNLGTLTHSGAGTLLLGLGIGNQGLIDLTGNGTLTSSGSSLNNSSIGTVRRATSAGNFTINGVVAQGGTLSAQTGTLSLTNALTNNGWITGASTLSVGGVGLTNASNGTVAPGGTGVAATLTIAGNANLALGNLQFELDTPILYDRLAITGNAVLGTPILLSELNPAANVGNNFSLITYGGNATGSLPILNNTAMPDVSFTRSTTAPSNGALVANVTAVTTRWKDSATNQQWTTASNWTRGHVPTAQEDVVISPTGAQTITLAGAAGSALSIALPGDDTLRISGQTLNLGAATSTLAPSAFLELVGGALNGAGSTLNLSGKLTSTGASAIGLGTFNNSGSVDIASGSLSLNAFGADNGTYDICGCATLAIVGATRWMGSNSTLKGSGTLRLNGTGTLLTMNDEVGGNLLSAGTIDINSGNLLFSGFGSGVNVLKLASNGTLTTGSSSDMIDVFNSLSANGGKITGPGTLTTSGNSSVTGVLRLDGGNWVNSGSLSFSAGGSFDAIEVSNNAILTNAYSGTISSNNMQDFAVFSGVTLGTGGTVNNLGLIELTDFTTNTRDFNVTQLNNNGTLKLIGTGRIALAQANFAQAGTLTLVGGAKLFANSMTNTGLIEGVGTLDVGSGTVTNGPGGMFAPGDLDGVAGVGTLAVMGNLNLGNDSENRFDMTLGGSDRINVNGTVSFSGLGPLLTLNELNAPSFLGGELVTLITSTGASSFGSHSTTGNSDVTFRGNADTANKRYTAEVIGINNKWLNFTPSGGNWYSNANWSRGVAPNAYHDVTIDAASGNLVTISSGAAQARSIQLPGAANTLSVSGGSTSLTVNNPLDQTTGLIVITSSNTMSLAGGATLALGGGDMYVTQDAVLNMNAATLTASASGLADATVYNDGLINHIAGTSVLGRAGNKFVHIENTNTGTINVQSGQLTVAATHLHQHGLISLASAASSMSFLQEDLLNEGAIDLSGGSLNLGSKMLNNSSTGTVRGTGQITTSELYNEGTVAPGAPSSVGTLTIHGDFTNDSAGVLRIRADSASSSDQLVVNGSNISLDGTLSFASLGTHSYAAGNAYQPVSSTVAPTGGFAVTQGIGILITSSSNTLSGHAVTLSNPAGSIAWTGLGGDFEWDNPNNWNLNRVPQVGDIVIINPSGAQTILVDSATGLSGLSLSSTLGDDTLRIVAGGSLSIPGGSSLNGSLWVTGGTLTNSGSNTGASAAKYIFMSDGQLNVNAALDVKTLTFQGGALNISSSNTLNLTQNGNWNGTASISGGGSFVNAASSVLTLSGAGSRVITGTSLINHGLLRMMMDTSVDKLELASGSVLTNYGTISAPYGIVDTQVIAGTGTLDNQGGTLLVESNILHIRTGSLAINGGNLDAGEGTIQLDATTASYTGNVNLLSGATIITEGQHSFNNLTLSGGGTGYLRIQEPGNLGNLNVLYNDVKLENYANLQILSGTNTIPTGKTLDISSGYIDVSSNITGAGHIHVEGELAITGANITPSVYNNGVVAIFDTVNLSSLTQANTGGDLRLYGDATLIHGAGSLINPLGAAISGDGTINVGSGTLTNQGLIQIGDNRPVGSLKVVGHADLSAGMIEFDLAGPNAYDKFSATGNIVLPSSLKLIENTPFIGAGDSFTLIQSTSGSVSGAAPALSLVDLSSNPVSGVSLSKALGASSFAVLASNVTNKWASSGSGDWSVAANWSRGHVPRAAEDAYIDAPSTNSVVSITTAGMTARSVSFGALSDESLAFNTGTLNIGAGGISTNAGNTLFMSSGKLSSAGAMNFDGPMQLNGGQIDIGSALNSTGLISLNGTMIGAGSGHWNNSGILSGSGTLGIGSGTFFNTGTIAPGGSGGAGIATITIAGNADLTSGKLDIGLQNASNYDKLKVLGNLNAGGTISMTETSGPFLAGAEVFAPLSFSGNLTGTYPSVVSNVAGKSFAINASGTSNSFFTLTASTLAPAGSIFWDGDGGDGLWSNALNWSTDLLPMAGQRVTINPAGSGSVTIASGTNISGLFGLNLDASDALFITGGSLALPGSNLALNGTLNLQGGTMLGSSAGGTIAGQFNWSGGTFAGAGTYFVPNLSLAGSGVRTLSGASMDTFASTLSGGRLSLAGGNFNTSTGGLTINPSSTLAFDGGSLSTASLTNNGFVDVNTGNVTLNNTSAAQSGIFRITAPASMEFANNASLVSGANITGGAWVVANAKSVNAAGSLNRGTGGVTIINGSLTVGSGFETDQLILLSGASLASAGSGLLKVNTSWNDASIGSGAITGFGRATITQAAGDLSFNTSLSVGNALQLNASSGRILTGSGFSVQGARVNAAASGDIDMDLQANTVAAASMGGNITLDITGAALLAGLTTGASRVATVNAGGNIGQNAALVTSGKLVFDMNGSSLSLSNSGNQFGQGIQVVDANLVQLQASNVTPLIVSGQMNELQANAGAVQLGSASSTLNVSGPLTIVASSSISQGAALNVTGLANLRTTSGSIVLPAANQISSLTASAGTEITVNNLGNLSLGTISAGEGNGVSLQTTGTLSQASGLISSASTQLSAGSIGSASQAVQIASSQLSLQATSGDIYANNAQSSQLQSMSATGLARYSSAAGADISVVGAVQGGNVELVSGRHLVIGNSLLPVAVNASNSILFTGQDISIVGGSASGAYAKVRAAGGINVNSAGHFVIQGGSGVNAYSEVVVLGNLQATASVKASVIGGTGAGAYALLDPAQGASLLLNAPAVLVQGGAGAGAYAAILSDGNIGISGAGLSLLAGTGSDADAVVISRFGQISLPGNCNGCVNLTQMPIGDGAAVAGIFGPSRVPPVVPAEPNTNVITQSIILSTQLSQAEATLESLNPEPDKDKKKAPEIVVEGQICP